jgi:hypothetical protein
MSNVWRKFGWWWFHINGFVRGPFTTSQQAYEASRRAVDDPRYK